MHVIIIGAGEVGSSIAESLSGSHDVVVVDKDTEIVESLKYSLDCLVVQGDGTSTSTLQDVGVGEADMVIASTDDDEVNLVSCSTAKTVSEAFTIARVKNVEYLNTWRGAPGSAFGVDFMVCVNLLTAQDIVRIIGLPAARDVEKFAEGNVQMAEFSVKEDSPVANKSVQEADQYDSLTFAAILRNEEIEVPRGDSIINPGDRLVVIGSTKSVHDFSSVISEGAAPANDIVIVGGSDIGYQVSSLLERTGYSPRLLENNPDRARELAEKLSDSLVLEHDATDIDFLLEENIDKADVVIAALESDEKNLLVSLLAKQIGVRRTVSVVEKTEYVDLFEAVGVNVAVNPRHVTAEEIIRFTREERAENLSFIENERAEVIEIEIDNESVLANKSIREGVMDLPEGVVIGAITRNSEFVIPRGNTVVEVGDHVVIFAEAEVAEEINNKI